MAANPIEDYAAIGNCETMALVGRDGSIDWLGFPRFDSAACFAALLGDLQNGRWLLAPIVAALLVTRRYRGDTMILETTFETRTGAVCVIDFMTRREGASDLVRIVKGVRGAVEMHTELIARFEYGSVLPWVSRRKDGRREIVAGPDRLLLAADAPLRGQDFRTVGKFKVEAGEQVGFMLTWSPSYRPAPEIRSIDEALTTAESFWEGWSKSREPRLEWSEAVMRSLLTLKSLSHRRPAALLRPGPLRCRKRSGETAIGTTGIAG